MAADRVRDEAERLVAAAIAAVSMAARGMGTAGRSSIATGSPECCVCPVCRVIAAMRDPSAEVAEKLATGAGDLANGVASMLRALSRATGPSGAEDESTRDGDEFWETLRRRASAEARADATAHTRQSTVDARDDLDPWHAATTGTAPPAAPKPMAKKVAKKAVKKAVPPGGAEPAVPPMEAAPIVGQVTPATAAAEAVEAGGPAVKKTASAKSAPAKSAPAESAPAKAAVAKKAVKAAPAKKAVKAPAKKVAKKALPPVEEA
jgi:hypothetical protein